ncbi:hypothetical protein AB0K00_53165 [Dactylosporangium sp. NPDC049525]|uniref:hypothetical protein n=1 Tax=Dactylosporangium sp. NPDC049525 TaxID=3154730 RepID=UPI0034202678
MNRSRNSTEDPGLDLEDMIRTAQQRQAERADDPQRLRAALLTLSVRQTHRRRVRFVASVAAAAAAVLTVPLFVRGVTHQPRPAEPSPTMMVTRSSAPAPLAVDRVSLGLRPTWLPSGYTERSRVVDYSGGAGAVLTRMWATAPIGVNGRDANEPSIKLTITTTTAPASDPGPQDGASAVDVNGQPGVYLAASGVIQLSWPADERHVLRLEVRDAGLGKADVLRIARSMVADIGWSASALVLDWLPDNHRLLTVSMSGNSPIDWTMFIETQQVASTSPQHLLVGYGTTTICGAGGEVVSVGSVPGRIVTLDETTTCLVAGATAPFIAVIGTWSAGDRPITNDDLIHVAREVKIEPNGGDTGWIGTR